MDMERQSQAGMNTAGRRRVKVYTISRCEGNGWWKQLFVVKEVFKNDLYV